MFYKAKGPKGDIIEVTSKTYRVLYESRGYVLIDEEEPTIRENLKVDEEVVYEKENTDEEEVSLDENLEEEKAYKDMSVKELKSLLDEREISYKGTDKKEDLIALLAG